MFKVVETLEALPGHCYFCGSGTKGSYLDWGVSIEFYGALYTCNECTFSAAKLFGFLSPIEVNTLVDQNRELNERVITLEIQRSALAESVQSLAVANFGHNELMVVHEQRNGSTDSFSNDNSSDLLDDVPSVLDASEESESSTSEGTTELDGGTKRTSESNDDEGVDFVHSGATEPGEFSFDL